METIYLKTNGQALSVVGGITEYASDTVDFVRAVFDLDDDWDYTVVRAVWKSDTAQISTVLDADDSCIIPQEVLSKRSLVKVNLVASDTENDVVVDRITSYQVTALTVRQDVLIDGTETVPVTPSQFEQLVEVIKDDADRAEQSMRDAKDYADNAKASEDNAKISEDNAKISEDNAKDSETNAKASEDNAKDSEETALEAADRAEQAAGQSGYMFFEIDEDGHLIYERTDNVDVNFFIDNGHLYVGEQA